MTAMEDCDKWENGSFSKTALERLRWSDFAWTNIFIAFYLDKIALKSVVDFSSGHQNR